MRARLIMTSTVTAIVQLLGTSAFAHDVSATRQVAKSSAYCLTETGLVREDAAKMGAGKGIVRSYRGDCGKAVNRESGALSQHLLIWYSRTETGSQYVCLYTDWAYNEQPTWSFVLQTVWSKSGACGTGWYEVQAEGFLLIDGDWHGGSVRSERVARSFADVVEVVRCRGY